MNIVYTRAVTKDVKKIKDAKLKNSIKEVIQDLKNATSIIELISVKKMTGHPKAYRVKIGVYRLGFYLENDTITLARFLKRSDIYKVFPS
jgi:mRNA interferase RelE/StbE